MLSVGTLVGKEKVENYGFNINLNPRFGKLDIKKGCRDNRRAKLLRLPLDK